MRGCFTIAAARASLLGLAFAVASTGCPGVALSSTKHVARDPNAPFLYNTSGLVGIGASPASVTGPAVLQFQGLNGASYDPKSGQPIGLGQFVASPSTALGGASTLYKGTPFEVEIQAPGLDKTSTVPVLDQIFSKFGRRLSLKTLTENSLLLKGHLDGSVGGDGQAHVTATVDRIKLGSLDMTTQDHVTHYTFPIRFSQLKLPASWVMAATTLPTGSTSNTVAGINPTPAAQTLSAAVVGAPAPLAESFTVNPNATPTPEPSTIVVFATAFGGLVLAHRRRSTRRAS